MADVAYTESVESSV